MYTLTETQFSLDNYANVVQSLLNFISVTLFYARALLSSVSIYMCCVFSLPSLHKSFPNRRSSCRDTALYFVIFSMFISFLSFKVIKKIGSKYSVESV